MYIITYQILNDIFSIIYILYHTTNDTSSRYNIIIILSSQTTLLSLYRIYLRFNIRSIYRLNHKINLLSPSDTFLYRDKVHNIYDTFIDPIRALISIFCIDTQLTLSFFMKQQHNFTCQFDYKFFSKMTCSTCVSSTIRIFLLETI